MPRFRLAVALTAVLVMAACGGDTADTTTTTTATTSTTAPTTSTTAGEPMTVAPYFLMDDAVPGPRPGPFVVPVARQVAATEAVLRAALTELLAGPSQLDQSAGIGTAVPAGVELLDVAIADDVATVDLSSEFAEGSGTFEEMARLAQLVYTATRFDTVESVDLRIEGEAVETFGSHGLVIDDPLTRDDFEDLRPTILVDSPAWGEEVSLPLRLTGVAAVFEAVFQAGVYTTEGEVLAEPPFLMTDQGMGWGSFDETLQVSVAETTPAVLRVWEESARDGSEQYVREYPLTLVP